MSIPDLYAEQDALTDPGAFAVLFEDLPATPSELRHVVSELIMHVAWTERYGAAPAGPIDRDTQPVAIRLAAIQTRRAGSLVEPRQPAQRTYGTCRDYSLVLCSMLRHRGIPARVRCGFATYFASPYEDHWICEYWSDAKARWIRVDAQLDPVLRDHLGVGFDCADLPDDVFLTAHRAWSLVRRGHADPEAFGNGDQRGLWFLRVNAHRDLLAFMNLHVSAWDTWRTADNETRTLTAAEKAAVDDLVEAMEAAENAFEWSARLKRIAARSRLPPWQR